MSADHYDIKCYQLEMLADEIEKDFENDGKYKGEQYTDRYTKIEVEYDRLDDATKAERKIILKEVRSLIVDLRKCAIRIRELDYLMSGDNGAKSYLENLKEYGIK